MKVRNFLIYGAIVLLALLIRVHVASLAYPPQMDSVHYVQYGVRWAQGVPGQLSTIWQEAPILVSGLAYRWGVDPVRALQGSTVVYGVVIVLMTMLLAARLFNRPAIGWLAGLWAAASPGLVNYSVNCSAETGFGMLMLSAYALMAPSLRGETIRPGPLLLAYGLLGLGIYYKPLDTYVAVLVLTCWLVLVHARSWRSLPQPAAEVHSRIHRAGDGGGAAFPSASRRWRRRSWRNPAGQPGRQHHVGRKSVPIQICRCAGRLHG